MFARERQVALDAARAAARAIAEVQARGFGVEYKDAAQDDPVTAADRASNAAIVAALHAAFPGDVVVSEEDAVPPGFAEAHRCWFVDPLDGTREFVAGVPEWCVMIGLAVDGRAQLGVVLVPSAGHALVGEIGAGASIVDANGEVRPASLSHATDPSQATFVSSRSRRSPVLDAIYRDLGATKELRCGSVGVKIARLLLGDADAYIHPRGGPKLWDLCAPDAIVRAAGGVFTDQHGGAIDYARSDVAHDRGMVVAGPALHAQLLGAVARGLSSVQRE
jgi:3'(2'), 5'-bisphosphate nucleotidase